MKQNILLKQEHPFLLARWDMMNYNCKYVLLFKHDHDSFSLWLTDDYNNTSVGWRIWGDKIKILRDLKFIFPNKKEDDLSKCFSTDLCKDSWSAEFEDKIKHLFLMIDSHGTQYLKVTEDLYSIEKYAKINGCIETLFNTIKTFLSSHTLKETPPFR